MTAIKPSRLLRKFEREGIRKGKPAYRGAAGMPMFNRWHVAFGSKGGSVIWGMEEAFVPANKTSDERLKRLRAKPRESLTMYESIEVAAAGPDADGFAVFGRFPQGFLSHVLSMG